MLLTRLYLRNYRVYEEPLDLALPPGLIGIFGVNGSGKSSLLEAILWTLWGRARSGKDEVRTAGVGGDCVTEVEFEHEGHLYLVRRTLSGVNSTVKAEAHCDHLLMSEGVRDTGRYLHQVLGMDDAAFRASVFAEQKQLSAFSSQTPADRRKLVLQLLGITPLDAAREAARRDARETRQQHERLRAMLPDVDQLQVEADDARARAAAAGAVAEIEQGAADAARDAAARADRRWQALDVVRQEHEALMVEGRAARAELDGAVAGAGELERELQDLDSAAGRLLQLEPSAARLGDAEVRHRLASAVVVAEAAVGSVVVPAEPGAEDGDTWEAANRALESARSAFDSIAGQFDAVSRELSRARADAKRSAGLSGEADCPLCGQPLGPAFEQVQAHRAGEVAAAEARLASLDAARREQRAVVEGATTAVEVEARARQERLLARNAWEQAHARRVAAEDRLAEAHADLDGTYPGMVEAGTPVADMVADLVRQMVAMRDAAREAERIRGRLERKPAALRQLAELRVRIDDMTGRVGALRDKVKAMAFDPAALAAASADRDQVAEAAERAVRVAQEARLTAERERTRTEAEARRLADAVAQHDKLAGLATDTIHLGRVADLLNAFRTAVVASVGPRLAMQAAELFAELTDHEYDRLEVDPETYQLQIRDAGRLYGLERFSGSEVDLANLALRVAISEHVRFQSGGSVGLLVLDEVFGPLDEDRKARMLLALERLRGRFRQVLVVTHDSDIKEQLPNAVEVLKLRGRRATARLLNS